MMLEGLRVPMIRQVRRRLLPGAAAVLVASLTVLGVMFWWRGRPERHLVEAERALLAGRPDDALTWLDLPEATPGTLERALLIRARSALAQGRPVDAVRPLERIRASGPLAADVAFWKGRTLFAARQSLQAAAWFRQSLALRPDDAETCRWLAAAAYDLGAVKEAFKALRIVTRVEPRDARAWRTLGVLYEENAEHEQAKAAYETSLACDPDQPKARLELAYVLEALGQYDEAERQLVACRGRVSEADRLETEARCLRARGDRPRLRELIDGALARYPSHPGLIAQRGFAELADGRTAEGIACLDRALAADPYNYEWLYQRGLALRRVGRVDEARRDLAESDVLRRAIGELSALNDEAARNPFDADVRHRIGRLSDRVGKPDLAASWYLAALACDPRHEGSLRDLAELEARRRDRPGHAGSPRSGFIPPVPN